MTATPVLHTTRGLGIYVINSSKAFRRREIPGCLHTCSQLNAKQLEAKVYPKCIPLCCRPPLPKLCEDELLHCSPVLSDSHPVARGQLAICAPLQGGAHSCEHIFSHLMHHMWKEEAGIPSWPHCACGHRGAKPHTPEFREAVAGFSVDFHSDFQRYFFFSLHFIKHCIHLLSAINKK